MANLFNGMFFNAEGIGRGESYDKVCEADAKFTRIEGNTFHGNGRFGTYVLGMRMFALIRSSMNSHSYISHYGNDIPGFNFPKATDQSILNDGHNVVSADSNQIPLVFVTRILSPFDQSGQISLLRIRRKWE